MGFDYTASTRLGKQRLLEGKKKKNLVCIRTQEKVAVTTQETEPGLLMSVWESLADE